MTSEAGWPSQTNSKNGMQTTICTLLGATCTLDRATQAVIIADERGE